jgi:electron transfer flavoprotein beta subunit
MKIVVCVKQVQNLPGQIQLLADGSAVDSDFAERDFNEPDRYAVEEALRMRDAAGGGEVIAVTLGDDTADDAAREALAMGADRALRVAGPGGSLDPLEIARGLARAIDEMEPDLVVTGIQSTDAAQQATGPALAAMLNWPCLAGVTAVLVGDDKVEAQRELDGGRIEVVGATLPVVLVVQTGLNQPRYGTFKDKMKAKKADIQIIAAGDHDEPSGLTLRRVFFGGARSENMETIEGGAEVVAARLMELVRAVT